MQKKVLVFIFLFIHITLLSAQGVDTLQGHVSKASAGKIKSKRYSNGLTFVKMLLKSTMLTQQLAEHKQIPQNYIKRIRVIEGDDVVFNAIVTPYVARNPIFKFLYHGGNSSVLRLETVDNNNRLLAQESMITIENESPDLVTIQKVPENNHSINISNDAIQKQFGNRGLIKSTNIKITAPSVAANGGAVPITIQSNIKAKSVTLFATESDRQATYMDIKYNTIAFDDNDLRLVCQYLVQKRSIIDFEVKIKLSYGNNSKVLVLIEDEDGRLYMAEKYIPIGICIDSGG